MRIPRLVLLLASLVLAAAPLPSTAGPTCTAEPVEVEASLIRLPRIETVKTRPARGSKAALRLTTSGGGRGWVARIPRDREAAPEPSPDRLGNLPSAAVAEGRVFVGGGFHDRHLHAFDAKTGRRLWSQTLVDNGPSTVAVTPRYVVVNTESCTTYGLEPEDGKVAWSKWIGPNVSAAPTLVGDRIYTAHRTKEEDYVLSAMDPECGEVLWQRVILADLIGGPVQRGGRLYLTGRDGSVTAFGLDGGPLWATNPRAGSAPWIAGGCVFVAADVGWRTGPPAVRCLDATTGRPRWTTDTELRDVDGTRDVPRFETHGRVPSSLHGWAADPPRPVVLGSRCYVAGGRDLVVLDASTGEAQHIHRLPEGRRFHSAPAVIGKHLLFVTLDGLMLEIEPKKGRVERALALERTVTTQAVVSHGRAFVVTDGEVYGVPWGEPKDGAVWPQWGGGPGRNGIR